MGNLMTSMWTGVSGLRVNQSALNTTGHNLANVDTRGYVRQQILTSDFAYNTIGRSALNKFQVGLGTDMSSIRQVRDSFLDSAYRLEVGRKGFYDSQLDAVMEIEDLLGELNGEAFQESMVDLHTALSELQKTPDDPAKRKILIETCTAFLERSTNLSNQLGQYQVNLNQQIMDEVNSINSIGLQISILNDVIRETLAGGEAPNDFLDARNQLLDELGEKISITYKQDSNGVVTVTAEGAPFITETGVNKMKTAPSGDASKMLKVVWDKRGMGDVFNLDAAYSMDLNTDVGSLKGLLVARGGDAAKYTDIPLRDNYASDKAYENAVRDFNNKVNPSVIMSIQAQFDQLVHGLVTSINDIMSPNASIENFLKNMNMASTDGNPVTIQGNGINYTMNADGTANALQKYGNAVTAIPTITDLKGVADSITAAEITFRADGLTYKIDRNTNAVTITDSTNTDITPTPAPVFNPLDNSFSYNGSQYAVDLNTHLVTASRPGNNTSTFMDDKGYTYEIDLVTNLVTKSKGSKIVEANIPFVAGGPPNLNGSFTTMDGKTITLKPELDLNGNPVIPEVTEVEAAYTVTDDELLIWDEGTSPVGMDENNTAREVLFNRKNMDRYTQATMTINGEMKTVYIYNREDPESNYSLFTLGQIEINDVIKHNESKIPLSSNKTQGGEGGYDMQTCKKLLDIWNQDFATLDPNTLTKNKFMDYYTSMIGALSNRGKVMDGISTNQMKMVAQIDNERQGVMGVSSDEELTNLIKFQHAYNASAKYISAIDELLRHVIEKLG